MGEFIFLAVVFVGLIILGMPIAYSIAITAFAGMATIEAIPNITVPLRMANGLNNFVLLAVPLFILTANIMNSGKITKKMIGFSNSIVGNVKGGLAYSNILVSMLFAGISGSSTADAAGIGRILIPSMVESGYDEDTSVTVTAASSVIGIIIPPSIPMVIYAGMSNTNVADMFLGGLIPGILVGLGMMAVVFLQSFKKSYPVFKKSSLNEFFKNFKDTLPALVTPAIILGGVLLGVFTPTESAAFSAIYALLISVFYYKTMKFRDLPKIVMETMLQTGQALFTLAATGALSELLGYYGVNAIVDDFFAQNVNSALGFIIILIVFFLIVGTFMDNLPAIILFVPILIPTATRLGIDPIMLGIITVVTLSVGLITPPYGICLMIASSIGNLPLGRAFKAVVPYILVMVVVLVLLVAFPVLVTGLPELYSQVLA